MYALLLLGCTDSTSPTHLLSDFPRTSMTSYWLQRGAFEGGTERSERVYRLLPSGKWLKLDPQKV
jgi:hypothetical protein